MGKKQNNKTETPTKNVYGHCVGDTVEVIRDKGYRNRLIEHLKCKKQDFDVTFTILEIAEKEIKIALKSLHPHSSWVCGKFFRKATQKKHIVQEEQLAA